MAEQYGRPNYGDCDGFLIPKSFSVEAYRSAINYQPKPGELLLFSYPKCGTTWTQYIVMLILRRGKPFESQREFTLSTPFLELTGADAVNFMPGPGIIKFHLPLRLTSFSPDAKYIYVARNPRDCCVSFYHHTKNVPSYNFEDGTFEEFFELFINGKTAFGDYFDNLLPWYEHRNDPNVHFLTYEDLKKDTKEHVLKIAKFIGDEYYERLQNNSKELEDILHHSSLESMKKSFNGRNNNMMKKENAGRDLENIPLPSGLKALFQYEAEHPKLSGKLRDFIRKGIVGDWKNYFSPEQERRLEEWIKRKTEGSDVMDLWKDM